MTTIKRCFPTSGNDHLYQEYHDHEWGKLNLEEHYLYEMLVLESFQSGLSWQIVLHKRSNFTKAFANWDFHKIAKFGQDDFQHLMNDKGIIRNRLKISAAINNAQALIQLDKKYGSFGKFLKKFIPQPIIHHPQDFNDMLSQDEHSKAIAKAMKKEGFKFVGPVTIYSFLQAVGLINDHFDWCNFKY